MPRDGSDVYNVPSGTYGQQDTTIESARYNAFVDDVAQDLNHPRPILAGGTAATTARDAMIALSGEIAGQMVTNYDTFAFLNGSFSSVPGATSAPVAGRYFSGVCYGSELTAMVLEARDLSDTVSPGRLWVRQKVSGVWGPWKIDGRTVVGTSDGFSGDAADMFFGFNGTAPSSAFIVNTESDVSGTNAFTVGKSGGVNVNALPGGDAALTLNGPAGSAGANYLSGVKAGVQRWLMRLGNAGESGGNVGSDFDLHRYADSGAYLGMAMTINRSSGLLTTGGGATIGGALSVGGAASVAGNLTVGGVVRGNGACPPGAIMDFGTPTAPAGWLVCDGASYATSAFPDLFNAIQYTWGGSGANFNVPPLVNRFRRASGGLAGAVGTLQNPANLAHVHQIFLSDGRTGASDRSLNHQHSGTSDGMNRSNPHSHGAVAANGGVILSNSIGGSSQFFGGGLAVLNAWQGFTITNTDIQHEHTFTSAVNQGGVDHLHRLDLNFNSQGGSTDNPSEARPYSATVLTCIKV